MIELVIICFRFGDLFSLVFIGILNFGFVLLVLIFEGRLVGVFEVDIRGWRDNIDFREEVLVRGGDRIMVDFCVRSFCFNILI